MKLKIVKGSDLPLVTELTGLQVFGLRKNADETLDNVRAEIELLKGNEGYTPQKGVDYFDGKDFKYEDFTPEQLEALKGEKGDKLSFADLSEKDKQELKGDKGNPFTYEDFTSEQLAKLKGEKGDKLTFADLSEADKQELKGEKGDPFTYENFTEEQLEALKGADGYTPKKGVDYFDGKDFKYEDFTPEQLASLKGEKGDGLNLAELSPEEIAELNLEVTKESVETALGHTVNADVPAGAKFTDTIYQHPDSHPATIINETTEKRFVSDAEKQKWDSKWDYNEEAIKSVKVDNATNADDAKKVNGHTIEADVPSNAKFTDTVYQHPATHPASMIKENTGKRFVSDAEKSAWNSKWDYSEATIKAVKVNRATTADKVVNLKGGNTQFWIGTQQEYDAAQPFGNDVLAIITD